MKVSKIPMLMHEKCMKTRNKLEKEGQKGLTGLQGQKFEWWSLEPTRREKEEKNYLKKSKSVFLKRLIHAFRSVENHLRSVETNRDSLS